MMCAVHWHSVHLQCCAPSSPIWLYVSTTPRGNSTPISSLPLSILQPPSPWMCLFWTLCTNGVLPYLAGFPVSPASICGATMPQPCGYAFPPTLSPFVLTTTPVAGTSYKRRAPGFRESAPIARCRHSRPGLSPLKRSPGRCPPLRSSRRVRGWGELTEPRHLLCLQNGAKSPPPVFLRSWWSPRL